jgi:hypothetical protein
LKVYEKKLYLQYTATSIKSEKVEYERESLLGIAKKFIKFLAILSKPFALVFDFSALFGDDLN